MKKLLVSAIALLALAISPALGQVGGGVTSPAGLPLSGGTLTGGITVTSGTITADAPVLSGTQTWNNAAVTFHGTFLNITNTASGASSKLVDIQLAGSPQFQIDLNGSAFIAGNIQLQSGGYVTFGARTRINDVADGQIRFTNNNIDDFSILNLGLATAAFPALKRSGTALKVRLGDDSADAPLTASTGVFSSTLASTAHTVTSASATALAVGLSGATNPAFTVDSSTGLQVAGLSVKGAVTGGTVAIATTDSGAASNLTIDAKGSGTIQIGGTSTGAITLTRATTMSNALTYGGVTLSNAVTGTGNMVLSAGPTLTGTITAAAADFSGAVSLAGTTTQKTGTFQYVAAGGSADVQTLTYSPAITAYATGQTFYFRAVGSNTTTTPTLNVNGLGAKTMVKRASTALAASDLLINGHYIAIYNGTNMQIINPAVPRRRPANDNRGPTSRVVVRRYTPLRRAA